MPGQLQPGRGASRAALAAEAALKPADPLVRSLGVNGRTGSLLSFEPVDVELDVEKAGDAEPVDLELDGEQAGDAEPADVELDAEQAGDASDCKVCRASASLSSLFCTS